MPPTKTEPAPATEEAAAPAPAAPAPPSSGSGFKLWLPLIITVAVMPVLAYAMTSFVLVPRIQKGLGMAAAPASPNKAEHKSTSPAAKKESIAMNKLLVNVAGTMGARYLLVSLSVAGTDSDFKAKLEEFDPQLRDMACGALRTKTLADLEKPGACNLIRSELISGFNTILGGAVVQDIYFTEFAIQ